MLVLVVIIRSGLLSFIDNYISPLLNFLLLMLTIQIICDYDKIY